MKPIHFLWRWQSWGLLLIGVTIAGWPAAETGLAQQVLEQKKESVTPAVPHPRPQVRQEVESIPLKYANARNLWDTIQQMFGGRGSRAPGHDLRVSIDERSNSVLAIGDPEDIALLKSLLGKLDVPRTRAQPTAVFTRVYHLQNTPANPSLTDSLRLVLSEGSFRVDPTRNLVVVTGDEKLQAEARDLLMNLDRPPENKPKIAGEMQVRVVWLSSGLPGIGAEPAPEDLKSVVGELAKMGIQDPRLVTQTLVTALPDRKFELGGLAGPESQYRLSISGTLLAQAGEAGRLRILIDARQSTTNATVGRVDTEITTPLGHSVVLGMTPTARTTSVFVVQILPRK
jgi:hypothetical protein